MPPADAVLVSLARHGLLLKQDKTLPNVVGLLTGESLRTSWWSHPRARQIFAVLSELADHPDVLFLKLLLGKDTLVHRSLWPAVVAVGRAREPWQLQGLSREAKRLLERVDRADGPVLAVGPPVRELEVRLLAVSQEVHTQSGRHEMALEKWQAWSARAGCGTIRSVPRARSALENAAVELGARIEALPWRASNAAV